MSQTAAQREEQLKALKAEGIPVAKSKDGHLITRFWMKIWCFQENSSGEFTQVAAFVPVFTDSRTAIAAMRVGPNPDANAIEADESLLPLYVDSLQKWMDRVNPQLLTKAEASGHREPDPGLIKKILAMDRKAQACAAKQSKESKPGKNSRRTLKPITVTKETRKNGRFKATGKG